ncbi:MAG: cytochrome b/b6 domain-containing protein [Steroidobacteraceae bacterium]
MTQESTASERIRVWDLPTRLSHWSIVLLFGICWWTAESDHMHWHRIAGYGVLGVVWFRLAWGFCGGETARFSHFVRGPAATLRYLRKLLGKDAGSSPDPIGHNPLGALSILVMLGLLFTQTALGLFTVNVDGVGSGPFTRWVSFDTGRRLAHLHAANFDLLLVVIGVHLGAIAFYRFVRRDNLVPAMIHGFKSRLASAETPYSVPGWRAVILAAGIFICVALLVNAR